jgi:NAD(P)-dependent dehydrogenase (short-subunit alcohol dehydrogenase family)
MPSLFFLSPYRWLLNRLKYAHYLWTSWWQTTPRITQGEKPAKKTKPMALPVTVQKHDERGTQQWLVEYSRAHPTINNSINRQFQKTCGSLYTFEQEHNMPTPRASISLLPGIVRRCYGCNTTIDKVHANYLFSCVQCGALFQRQRHFSTDQSGKVAVVIGARTKLGHQVVLKLLRAGAHVIATTRYPDRMRVLFESYLPNRAFDMDQLSIYPHSLDLDSPTLHDTASSFRQWIHEELGFPAVDIYVHCAAQTIRCREKKEHGYVTDFEETNKYGDAKFVNSTMINSWQMTLPDLVQEEMEEIFRVNVAAPTLLIQCLLPLFRESKFTPYLINVHAREGLISVPKSPFHMHTNFGKAGLHMLTKCLIAHKLRTKEGKLFAIHGCCPGFISVDEYFEESRPWIVPPIDEVDGAARVLYPLFKNIPSEWRTRRHFTQLIL